ncbi:MAG: SpoIIE family protein phosphatase [Saprospiraceae bacterium]|nr:SpoIIE family protein phosphatase [Saprospiraceae bacterium]MBP8942658.1 SpoIIE family protein phosphatase [Saprospiraceae bacterium]
MQSQPGRWRPIWSFLYILYTFGAYGQIQPLSRNDSAFVAEAQEKYEHSLSQNNLKQASGHLNDIAFKYWNHNDYNKAIEYYEKSLGLNKSIGNENGEAMINSNLGLLYADVKNFEKSYSYFQRTLAARKSFDQKEGVVQAMINCAGALNALKRYPESLDLLEEAASLARQIKRQDLMLEYLLKCYANLSETYEKAGDLKKSRHYYDSYKIFLEKSKSMDLDLLRSKVDEERVLKELAIVNEQQKEKALLQKQYELKKAELELNNTDSINQKLFEDLDKSAIQLLALKQKSTIDSLNAAQEKLLNQAIINQERSFRNILGIIALALIAISFFIYRNFIQERRSKKILAEKNQVIEKQNKELSGLNRIIAKHNERMKKELDVGQEIQMSMLPKVYPTTTLLDMYALLNPAREVGGDLYDFFMIDDDHLLFGIGDVSGKGVPAALFMAVTKTLVKAHGGKLASPGDILTAVNIDISASNDQSMFVSYFLGILDLKSGALTYSNAGHLMPLLKMEDTCRKLTGLHGPVLGAIENYHYTNSLVNIKQGELFLLFTDGVTEAMNQKHELYSDDRLFSFLQKYKVKDTKSLIEALIVDLDKFTLQEEQSDDITIMALSRK